MNNEELQTQTLVGIGVMILKEGKVLLGRRRSSHGTPEHSFPSVRLKHLESFEDCARRAAKDECGLEIENVRFQYLANIKHYAPMHYVFIGMIADWKAGDPQELFKGSSIGWEWHSLDALPRLLLKNVELAVEAHTKGTSYFDVVE